MSRKNSLLYRCHVALSSIAASALLVAGGVRPADSRSARHVPSHNRAVTPLAPHQCVGNLQPVFRKITFTTGSMFADVFWISDEEVVAHTNLGDGYFDTPYRYNLRTKQVTLLDRPSVSGCKPGFWLPSPNRKRVLWHGWDEDRNEGGVHATSLDGTPDAHWKISDDLRDDAHWMPDGDHWVRLTGHKHTRNTVAEIYNAAAPRQSPRHVPIPISMTGRSYPGILPNGRLLVTDALRDGDHPGLRSFFHLWSFRMDHPGKSVERFTVRLPSGVASFENIVPSPDGKLLAYLTWSNVPSDSDDEMELWISKVDGSHLHRLGRVPGYMTCWYPNSQAILFQTDNSRDLWAPDIGTWCLYRVPVR